MYIDNSLILDDNLALTTTGASTNYIDTIGAAGGAAQLSGINAIQGGYDAYDQCWWQVLVRTAFVGTGATLTCYLLTGPTAASIATPTTASVTVLLQSAAIAVATLVAKYKLMNVRIPQGVQRFIGGYYTVGVNSFSAGNIDSKIVRDIDINLT